MTEIETPSGRVAGRVVDDDTFTVHEFTGIRYGLPPVGPLEREHYGLFLLPIAIRNFGKFSAPLFEAEAGMLQDWQIMRKLAEAKTDLGWTDSRLKAKVVRLPNLPGQPWNALYLGEARRDGELPILGFRIGNVAFLTDVSTIPPESKELLHGLAIRGLDRISKTAAVVIDVEKLHDRLLVKRERDRMDQLRGAPWAVAHVDGAWRSPVLAKRGLNCARTAL